MKENEKLLELKAAVCDYLLDDACDNDFYGTVNMLLDAGFTKEDLLDLDFDPSSLPN